jgi:hypothetical protein
VSALPRHPTRHRGVTVVLLALLLGLTGAMAPVGAAPVARAAAGPQQVLAFVNVFGALFQRNRVYRNAAQVQDEIRAHFDQLEANAGDALRTRDVILTGSQTAAYIRLIATLRVQREAALQLLEDDKRGQRQVFQSTLNRQLPVMLLAIPAVREMAITVRSDLGDLRAALSGLRAAVTEGRAGALAEIAIYRARLDRAAGVVSVVGGRAGRQLADAIGQADAALQRLVTQAEAVTEEVDEGLASADTQLLTAAAQLDLQLEQQVRPVTIDLGPLGTRRVPGEFGYYAALAEALSRAGSQRHGLTRDAMRDRIRQFLLETDGARLTQLRDCLRATGAQLRAQFDGADAPEGSAAALLLGADLRSCDPETVAAVLAAAAEYEAATTTTTIEPTATGDPAAGAPEPAEGATAPVAGSPTVSGGGIHAMTSESPGIRVGNNGETCLDYGESRGDDLPLTLTACTTDPRVDAVFDLAAGTVAGTFELDLACPGGTFCAPGETTTATVRGTFGPLVFGQQPETAPPDFPFPPRHYYVAEGWAATGRVMLDISISGSREYAEQVVSGSASTSVAAWVTADLGPSGIYGPDQPPTGWWLGLSVSIDLPDTTDPYWSLWAGWNLEVEESGIPMPPWDD